MYKTLIISFLGTLLCLGPVGYASASNLPVCKTPLFPRLVTVTKHNCYYEERYSNGASYAGEWRDQKFHGQGTYVAPGGHKYVGSFKNDQYHGQGTFIWPDGQKYVGEWRDSNRHGQGTLILPSGAKYVGEFKEDLYYGQGAYISPNGDKYVGEWRDGKRNGQGTLVMASGEKYVGEWRKGKRNGQGTNVWPNGMKYVGEFRNGNRNGQGTNYYADGRVESGHWADDILVLADKNAPPVKQYSENNRDTRLVQASSGSAFAVSVDGHVITNHHVIEGCQEIFLHTKGTKIPADLVIQDRQNDLALLKGRFTPSRVLPLATSNPELMEEIYVAGYPFGKTVSSSVKITKGIISSLSGIGDNFSNIQIDAALQSGNSGGPIFDDLGNVVGVAVAKLDAAVAFKAFGDIPENTNFGIKSSVVKNLLASNDVKPLSANQSEMTKTKLGKMISEGTFYVSCHMTLAQIEQMRSKKVLFQDLN